MDIRGTSMNEHRLQKGSLADIIPTRDKVHSLKAVNPKISEHSKIAGDEAFIHASRTPPDRNSIEVSAT